jgi:hypothetical protein
VGKPPVDPDGAPDEAGETGAVAIGPEEAGAEELGADDDALVEGTDEPGWPVPVTASLQPASRRVAVAARAIYERCIVTTLRHDGCAF